MNQTSRFTVALRKLLDIVAVIVAYAATTAVMVRMEGRISLMQFLAMRAKITDLAIFLVVLLVFHATLNACGLYRPRRLSRRRTRVFDIMKATTFAIACVVVLSSIFSIRMVTVNFLAVFWVLTSSALLIVSVVGRLVATHMRLHGRNLRHLLILGSNQRAIEFAQRISGNRQLGYHVLGFVDDEWSRIDLTRQSNYPVVSNFAGLAEFLRRNVVDEVAIYLPFASFYKHSAEVAGLCEQHGISMRFNSDIFGLKATRWRSEAFDGEEYIATYTESAELLPQMIKRALDITVSAVALLVFSPILVAAAIAIRATSKGDVIFKQERVGLNKRRFKIYKFRTMVVDAEKQMANLEKQNEISGPVFKIKNDPRITRVGRFLRKSSIDELPQLFNVLQGDMSLVGPRPLPVRDYEGFNEDWQRRRFAVKPGITCLWQVNGRSGISFDKWMLLDLQYMDEWSLWLDFKILAKTIPAVFKGAGAA